MYKKIIAMALLVSLILTSAKTTFAEKYDININETLKTTRTESEFNNSFFSVTGYASGKVSDRSEYYGTEYHVKVADADEFISALELAKSGAVKVIEITGDLNLGYNELSEKSQKSSLVDEYEKPASAYSTGYFTNPTIKESGITKIAFSNIDGLTIFSEKGNVIRHGEFKFQPGSNDIVLRNLEFDDMWQWDEAGTHKEVGWSFIKVNGANNIWIDHCSFSIAADGLVDLENGSSGVTYSWCTFGSETEIPEKYKPIYKTVTYMEELYKNGQADSNGRYSKLRNAGVSVEELMKYENYHSKVHIVGNEKQFADDLTNNMNNSSTRIKLTLAYNMYTNVGQRIPRLSCGKAHLINVYFNSMEHMKLHNSVAALKSTGGLGMNQCIDVKGSASCAADTCVFYGVNNPIRGIEKGTATSGSVFDLYANAENRALVINSSVTNLSGKTYTGSSWDDNGVNLFTNGYNWVDKTTIGKWVWGRKMVGYDSLDNANPPSVSFTYEDDPDDKLEYNYQVLPLSDVKNVVEKCSGAFAINMSALDWLKTTYASDADISLIDKSNKVLAEKISIRQNSQKLSVGDFYQLDADITPANASEKNVVWSSSDSSVMEVLDSGLVKVKKSGSAKITAKTIDGSNLSESITLTSAVSVESLKLSNRSKTIKVGETYQIGCVVTPENAENKSVIWSSSNEAVVVVDDSGTIKGIDEGKATITCKSEDNEDVRATLVVTVKGKVEIEEYILGDIDGNKIIDASDALMVLKHAAKLISLDENQLLSADTDGNGTINATDALTILKYASKLIEYLGQE